MQSREAPPGPRAIKRYGNRRLYDTIEHRYISRDELADLARHGVAFAVHDARTGEDLTHATLLSLLVEGSSAAYTGMTLAFLRELTAAQATLVQGFFENFLPSAFRAYARLGTDLTRLVESAAKVDPGTDAPDRGDGPAPTASRPPRKTRSARTGRSRAR